MNSSTCRQTWPLDRRDPVDALADHAVRRQVDGPQAVDGREGEADAKVGPGELHLHVLREGRRVAQLDTDLGRLAGQRRVGMDGDLALGVGRVGEGMELDRRAIDLAESADQFPFSKGLHVDDGLAVLWQGQASRRGHRQAHVAHLARLHVRQDVWHQLQDPAVKVGDQTQSMVTGWSRGLPTGKNSVVGLAGHQWLVDVDVALAALGFITRYE